MNARTAALFVAMLSIISACQRSRAPESDEELARYFAAQSDSGAAAWNRGDLVAFGKPYSDSVVIVYPDGPVRGLVNAQARQQMASGWNGAVPSELATIGSSQMRRLGPHSAMQIAEIVLRAANGTERRLWATVIWEQSAVGWRVTHEQSF